MSVTHKSMGYPKLGALSLRARPRLVALASARQWRRRRRRRREEEEKGPFNTNAANLEGSKRDRATLVWRSKDKVLIAWATRQHGSR